MLWCYIEGNEKGTWQNEKIIIELYTQIIMLAQLYIKNMVCNSRLYDVIVI